MSEEPDSLILELLRKIRAEISGVRGELEEKTGSLRGDLSAKIDSLRADFASDFVLMNAKIDAVRKETGEQIVGLRRAVVEYHSSVVGHGMLISDLEARVRRVEQHLGLPAVDVN